MGDLEYRHAVLMASTDTLCAALVWADRSGRAYRARKNRLAWALLKTPAAEDFGWQEGWDCQCQTAPG